MAQTNFTLLINLSNFFKDHRKIARIFIGDKITRIQDIQNKITIVFGIENFCLLSNNEYLPPSEDIRILRKDDIVWAIPAQSGNVSYENIDVENEYAPTKLKKTKRKSNSAVNGTDEYEKVSKRRKQEDCTRGKPPKSEGKTEEIEYITKCCHKKKKKHIYEEVQPEDEHIPKISKKKKYKDLEQTETNKVQKQIENSKKKNVSVSNKFNYSNKSINEYQVTVGNSLPENVSFKKITQIPTITEEYLKEKKINIVKIDYISKPPAAEKIETGPIQNETEIVKNTSDFNESKSNSAHKIESGPSQNATEIRENYLDNNETKSSSEHKIEIGSLQNQTEIRKNYLDYNVTKSSSAHKIEFGPSQNETEIRKNHLDYNVTKSSSAHKIEIGPSQNETEIRKNYLDSNVTKSSSVPKIEIGPSQIETEIRKNYLDYNVTKSSSVPKIEIGPSQNETEIRKNYLDYNDSKSSSAHKIEIGPSQNEIEKRKNYFDYNETKSSLIKNDSGAVKTTKFFFLNTPSRQKVEKPVKQKRSNLFKLNISPIVNKVNKIELLQEITPAEEKRNNMFELGLSPVVRHNEKLETTCEKVEEKTAAEPRSNILKLEMNPVETENKETYIETSIDVIENYTLKPENSNSNDMHREKINVADDIMQVEKNTGPPSELTNGHSVETSPSIYIQDTHIIPAPTPENIETSHASGIIIDSSMEIQGNSPALNVHSSFQPISEISPCITTILDTPVNELGISGIECINRSKYSARKQISGVGQLLGSIRNSESCSTVLETSPSGDTTEFVTKRKRTRRTRSKKKKNPCIIADETLSPINSSISYTPRPMLTEANPKHHFKFSDDGKIDNIKNDSVISIGSDTGDLQLVEENILKAPLMSEKGPEVGNIISFKILKITDDFTPEISSYIIGRVVEFSAISKLVVFEITLGLEQFEQPRGKFALDDKEKRSMCVFKECLWSDLVEPRLIDP
ncbi:unnamed protein product [Psylliodes chrysocephalus]|uniref:Coilin n=1 Tax=Psylliodes chrysocephalus TaxID=3402493 RepID=A0A9P0CT79_9CUCU|nr:unnamed protein product [Psylliodes chrysocephala]